MKTKGSGGHGSSPHNSNDSIVAGAYFVTEIQSIVLRRLNPFESGMVNELEYNDDYPTLYNGPELTGKVSAAIDKANIPSVKGVERCEPQPPLEDFAYYSKELPSSFIYIGASPDGDAYPHHHPKFDINEQSSLVAAQSVGAAAIDYLMENEK